MINKSVYNLKVAKAVCGGNRNVSSYYVVLISQNRSLKWISKTMRNDEDADDILTGEGQMVPAIVEFWNYDKMTLMAE